jgi:hypothetical protein
MLNNPTATPSKAKSIPPPPSPDAHPFQQHVHTPLLPLPLLTHTHTDTHTHARTHALTPPYLSQRVERLDDATQRVAHPLLNHVHLVEDHVVSTPGGRGGEVGLGGGERAGFIQ